MTLLAGLLLLIVASAAAAVSPQVAAGTDHTCALLPSGHIECWGEGFYGELGAGSFASANTAVEVQAITNATQITAGGTHSCALLSTGHIDCWGSNEAGQLGDGNTTSTDTPVEVAGITDATGVSAGERHTCAILSTGHVECWGSGEDGVLGDGTTTNSDNPVEVQNITNAMQVGVGGYHSCAVLTTGHIVCWGRNGAGELGDGNNTSSDTPVDVQGIANATAVAGGWEHTCALLAGGRVDCWGSNYDGQLGNGESGGGDSAEVPTEVESITSAKQLATGWYHTCAVLAGGHIECWGSDEWGQLGNGSLTAASVPVEVQGITSAISVAGGEAHTCAALTSGNIDCWGRNYWEQLGDGTTSNSTTPLAVQGIASAVAVAAGSYHVCGILTSARVECWGNNEFGQLGNGATGDADEPVQVQSITSATQLAAGLDHTCGVLSTGHVDCWGDNAIGQLGDGTTSGPQQCRLPGSRYVSCSTVPVEVQGITNADQAAAGSEHTCAVLATGHVVCWGRNSAGQLGNATTSSSSTPVEVQGITTAMQVAAGNEHTCAVLSSGHVDCWGKNTAGQLGNASNTSSSTPVEVQGITTATQVAAGFEHSCALIASGHIECWGRNSSGQLGNSGTTNTSTPIETHSVTNAIAVTAGAEHTCTVLSNGHIDCWGLNNWGQLGNASDTSTTIPVEVQGIANATDVTAGGQGNTAATTCSVLASGHIDCWGYDYYGQLGSGTAWSTLPTGVLGVSWSAAPTVVTGTASAVTQTSATLNATVNPEGATVTSCEFEYGTSASYGTTVPCSALPGAGTSPVAVSAPIEALSANTPYHYRIQATNASGTSHGSDGTLTTPPNAPAVVTGSVSNVGQTTAMLEASVDPEGGQITECQLEYGTTSAYGARVACDPMPGSGTNPIDVSAAITGLTADTGYDYRIEATNAGGMSFGNESAFETGGPEFGRCVKLTAPSGAFGNAACTKTTGTLKYEWYPAFGGAEPLAKTGFTTTNKAGTTVKLETKDKQRITCTGESSAGHYTTSKTVGSIVLTLTGCHNAAGDSCESSATQGEILTTPLTGTLGVIAASSTSPIKDKVGVDLKPAPGAKIAEFACGGVDYTLTGAVIAEVKANTMQLDNGLWKLAEAKGVQTYPGFEGRSEQGLQVQVGTGSPEQAGLTLAARVTNEEKIEITTDDA